VDVTDFSELPAADQEAIGSTLLTLLTAFENRDAEALQEVYSADADWVNAFGTVKRGRDEIVDYLRGLFRDDNFNRGELAGPPETSFKAPTPEVRTFACFISVEYGDPVETGWSTYTHRSSNGAHHEQQHCR
jgi:hypothetical protein